MGRLSDYFSSIFFSLLNVGMHWMLITLSHHSSSWLLRSFFRQFFCSWFFSLNFYKGKESQTDTREKETLRQIYENFPWQKLRKPSLPEKPDCILKKRGIFFGKYFRHLSHSVAKCSKKTFFFGSKLSWSCLLFFAVTWIFI